VKVPPISTATANSAGGIGHFQTCSAHGSCGWFIDHVASNHHAISSLRRFKRDEPIANVLQHLMRRAFKWMAMAATSAGFQ
jgi:hypothetical protein